MEVLEGIIHAADIRGKFENSAAPLELQLCMSIPVRFLAGKAGVHVTADEADFRALFEREQEEIVPEGAMVNGGKNVKDSTAFGVGKVLLFTVQCH